MQKNVTYLIGAGASNGTLPINSELINSMINQVAAIKEEFNQTEELSNYSQDVSWLVNELKISHMGTIDELAKNLYTKQNAYRPLLGEENPYFRLKNTITTYFLIEQSKKRIDSRYCDFVRKSARESKRNQALSIFWEKNNVNILSWNYDIQLELAIQTEVCDLPLSEIKNKFGIINKNERKSQNDKLCYKIFKLNGTCGFADEGFSPYYLFERNIQPINTENISMILKNHNQGKMNSNNSITKFLLSFAFESEMTSTEIIDLASNKIKKTETLIVIGYSFPKTNEVYDRKLLGSMSNLKNVIIKSKDKNWRRIKNLLPKNKKISHHYRTYNSFIHEN